MFHERLGRVVASARAIWALALVLGLFLLGCGGASKMAEAPSAAAPMAPGEPGPAREETASTGTEADEAVLYRAEARDVPAHGATGGVAQATPPPMPAPKPEPAKEKKSVDANDGAPMQGQPPSTGVTTGTGDKTVASPMLIYKANLYMAVFETRKSIDAVEKLAKDAGGYLVSREDNRITVRVPAGKFDGAIDQIAKLGDLLHRNVSVEDVTDQYFDLQIRLRNLEVMRDRLEELLKKAAKVEEALAVQRELERVTGEVERLKGRLKLLRELVSFSTITVEFQPRPADHIDSKVRLPFPWLDRLGLGELLRL